MIRIVMIGFWACLTTLAAGYAMTHVRAMEARPAVVAEASQTRALKKTKEVNVPKIRDGVVKGYIVAQFSFVVDNAVASKSPLPPDDFIVDEAFRYLFADPDIDFDHLETFDLKKLTDAVIKGVNARLNANVVTDVGIQEFTFLSAAQAKKRL
ncbi:MAG: hypothetical protein E7774_01555 [Bradyrhizobium sp.]|nr:MAG: hypothetical protein E7774_01555 [Bradyrhizobium sp.]